MIAYEFGTEHDKRILLIPGNMMSWRQFEDVIPILAEQHHVIAISTDGYDGSGNTTFTTSKASAASVEAYLAQKKYDSLALVFGESFGCATAVTMFRNQNIRIDSMILSGPQYMNFGILNGFFKNYIPKHQHKLLKKVKSTTKVPWMLKAFTRSDDTKMLKMFGAAAENVSLETLRNCTDEAFRLYADMETFERRADVKVSVWHGEKEPNMKKAILAIRNIYPAAEDHPFEGLGHGDIIGEPEWMAQEIEKFLECFRD
ncbi:MAG: alpha/beta hydrolase [Lachnospiraceae bacterium]|nr:alpha/beta hydrolase [Lachnospiraceae bacterium]